MEGEVREFRVWDSWALTFGVLVDCWVCGSSVFTVFRAFRGLGFKALGVQGR